MSIVELQPAVVTSFSISDTRSPSTTFLSHMPAQALYNNSRHSSKENRAPTPTQSSPQVSTSPSADKKDGANTSPETHSPRTLAGKKRSASGHIKELEPVSEHRSQDSSTLTKTGKARAGSTNMAELSARLRTRLTYAMVKVQHGWQSRPLDEVESIASASPRSVVFNQYSNNAHLLSPRAAISARQSPPARAGDHGEDGHPQDNTASTPSSNSSPSRQRVLAPAAPIISRPPPGRRRSITNKVYLDIETQDLTRPTTYQRTPSQNAVLEADAVETLMFMASPNISGSSAKRSQFSPIASVATSCQISPLHSTSAVPTILNRSVHSSVKTVVRSKDAVVDSLLENLDDDNEAELNAVLEMLDRHHAAKVTAS